MKYLLYFLQRCAKLKPEKTCSFRDHRRGARGKLGLREISGCVLRSVISPIPPVVRLLWPVGLKGGDKHISGDKERKRNVCWKKEDGK